jgi:SAM-dependent methyltransferase
LSIIASLRHRVGLLIKRITFSPIKYWENRARQYGARSVLNLSHGPEEMASVKEMQINTIFPLLKLQLGGDEKTLLDFGCGPGRFTIELADLTGCRIMAADPIDYLLQLAPKDSRVSYQKIVNRRIPTEDGSIDIIWICLVLGGIISKNELSKIVREIKRIANKNALLFLVENTTDRKNIISWHYRSKKAYIALFKEFNLVHLKDYDDSGECNSIFAGRMNNLNQ